MNVIGSNANKSYFKDPMDKYFWAILKWLVTGMVDPLGINEVINYIQNSTRKMNSNISVVNYRHYDDQLQRLQ